MNRNSWELYIMSSDLLRNASSSVFKKKCFLAIYCLFYLLRFVGQVFYYDLNPIGPGIGLAAIVLLSAGSLYDIKIITKLLSVLIVVNSIGTLFLAAYAIYRHGAGDLFGYLVHTAPLVLLLTILSIFFLTGAIRLWNQ